MVELSTNLTKLSTELLLCSRLKCFPNIRYGIGIIPILRKQFEYYKKISTLKLTINEFLTVKMNLNIVFGYQRKVIKRLQVHVYGRSL